MLIMCNLMVDNATVFPLFTLLCWGVLALFYFLRYTTKNILIMVLFWFALSRTLVWMAMSCLRAHMSKYPAIFAPSRWVYYPVIFFAVPTKNRNLAYFQVSKNIKCWKNYVLHCFCADFNVQASTTDVLKDAQAIFSLLIWLVHLFYYILFFFIFRHIESLIHFESVPLVWHLWYRTTSKGFI